MGIMEIQSDPEKLEVMFKGKKKKKTNPLKISYKENV